MRSLMNQFWNDEEGATAVEYALIVGLIAIAIITAVQTLGENLAGLFETIRDTIGDVEVGSGSTT